MATWGPMSLSEPLLEPVTQSFFMAEVPNSSHAVFLDASWEGLALQAAVHTRVFPRVPHDLGAGHGGGVVRKREVVENLSKEWKLLFYWLLKLHTADNFGERKF